MAKNNSQIFVYDTIKVRAIHIVNESEKRKLWLDVRLLPDSLQSAEAEKIMIAPGGVLYIQHPGKTIDVLTECLEEAIHKPKSSVSIMF